MKFSDHSIRRLWPIATLSLLSFPFSAFLSLALPCVFLLVFLIFRPQRRERTFTRGGLLNDREGGEEKEKRRKENGAISWQARATLNDVLKIHASITRTLGFIFMARVIIGRYSVLLASFPGPRFNFPAFMGRKGDRV